MTQIQQAKNDSRRPSLVFRKACIQPLRCVKVMAKEHTYKALAAEVRSTRQKRKPVSGAGDDDTGGADGKENNEADEDEKAKPSPKAAAKAKGKAKAKAKGHSKRQKKDGDS